MKFFVSTGEASGDLHLSYLVKSVKSRYKDVDFVGVAGEKSKKEGVEILQDISELAIMGFTEAIKKYKFLRQKAYEYLQYIKDNQIKNVILVDYGGFNVKFLKLLKNEIKDIKIFYYIPPKVWIWGEKRVKKLRLANHIMVIFPWEVDFYKKVERTGDKILLLPGSRRQEIRAMLPVFEEIINDLKHDKFILKLNSEQDLVYTENLKKYANLEIIIDKKLKDIVGDCKLSVATSGTITLELALLDLPSRVVYKTSLINYLIGKYILKIGYISLPNLVLNDEIFPELIQKDCEAKNIEKHMKKILENLPEIEEKIENMRKKIEGKAVVESYADFLVKEGK